MKNDKQIKVTISVFIEGDDGKSITVNQEKLIDAIHHQSTKLPSLGDRLNHLAKIGLTSRELEVLEGFLIGLDNIAISEKLFISVSTVKYHSKKLFKKMGVNSRTQAIYYANSLRETYTQDMI